MTEKYIIEFNTMGPVMTAKIEREFAPGVMSLTNFMAGSSAEFLRNYMLSNGKVIVKRKTTSIDSYDDDIPVTILAPKNPTEITYKKEESKIDI